MKPSLVFLPILLIGLAACAPPPPAFNPADTVAPSPTRMQADDTSIPASSPTAPPTATSAPPSPSPTPTLAPALVRLTEGGCCVQPFWSSDSKRVLFLDKPTVDARTGIYGVDVEPPGKPEFVSPLIANYTADGRYAVYIDGLLTIVQRLADGRQWKVRTGGRNLLLSPDYSRTVWNVTAQTYPFENRVTQVMQSELPAEGEATAPKTLSTLLRGGAVGWLDNDRLLMNARLDRNSQAVTLFVYTLADGSTRPLASSERMRGVSIAPGGKWIVYTVAFDSPAEQNGMWLVQTQAADGQAPAPRKLDFFGPIQWRDDHRLVYLPLDMSAPSHIVYEYDVETGQTRRLTDPAVVSFKIANGDWMLSPDGSKMVFVNSQDMNLWVLSLPR